MKCSVSSLIQRGDTDGVRDSKAIDVCLAIRFELWQYCTTVFAAVVPRRCVVFRPRLLAARCAAWVSRPPTVGAATAIGWWRCSGCLAYVMMDSVREKEE